MFFFLVEPNKSKYLLNDKNSTQSAIHDFFKFVSLNVNNPCFLILQGQVTKVLKSKPQEILVLIEETAGTRMYDQKKAEALKRIAKKDNKFVQQLIQISILYRTLHSRGNQHGIQSTVS